MGYLDSFEGALFDLDGTLTDSMPLWNHFCGDWLRGLGKVPEDSLEDDIAELSVTGCADYVNRRYGFHFSRTELLAQWEALMTTRYLNNAPLKQGAADLVRAFAQRGKKLGVATYSFPGACKAILARHGIVSCFRAMFFAHEFEEISGRGSVKKDPAFWLAAAGGLGLEPAKCIVFEDTLSSARGARAAGMSIAGVYDAHSEKWPDLREAADIAVCFPGEALKYFS